MHLSTLSIMILQQGTYLYHCSQSRVCVSALVYAGMCRHMRVSVCACGGGEGELIRVKIEVVLYSLVCP